MNKIQQIQNVKITNFALRHFDPEFGGTKILNAEPMEIEKWFNEELSIYNSSEDSKVLSSVVKIIDGYADFCKLIPVKNLTDAKVGAVPITIANYQYIRSGFSSRREGEFDTFSRWIELPVAPPKANYLMMVLYNKEQIDKEAMADYNRKKADGGVDSIGLDKPKPFEGDWGVVAILGQDGPDEEPMKPATFDRNYMPIEFGGSGMNYPEMPEEPNPLEYNQEKDYKMAAGHYKEALAEYKDKMDEVRKDRKRSVDFWKKHVTVK